LTLSVIVTFNKEDKIYYFKHNEIMALMFFNEQVQLQEKEIKQIQAKTFLGNWFNENFK
jgi:translation initiation factor IF-2